LLVSRVLGLRNVALMSLQPAQSLDSSAARRYVDSESQVWTELSAARILQDPRFLQVGL
jgi:twitching motility protein PilI